MAIDLTPYAEAINNSINEGSYPVIATQGSDGMPDIGYKGSVQVFDADHLAYWERTRGQHLTNVQRGGGVAVLYFNRERGKHLRAYGRAELYENGAVREQIMAHTPQGELDRDPERKGVGVLIRVDRLEELFGGVSQVRDGVEAV
jgi:hypothetical protein